MSASWPSSLPMPTLDGYSIKPKSRTVRTDMESGPARVRRRFRRVPTVIQVAYIFDQAEFQTFEYWFENTLNGGAEWFAGPAANGAGITTVQCRFIDSEGPYEARPLGGGLWSVTAAMEVDQMPTVQP